MNIKTKKRSILSNPAMDLSVGSHIFVPILIAILIGISTGLIAVGFIKMVGICGNLFFGKGAHVLKGLGRYYVILIPAVAGFLIGPLITFFAPEAKGHGVPEVLQAIAIKGGRIRPVVVVIKALASMLSLGAGFSVGREGPIVQIGSALGSTIGQILKFKEVKIKNLIACGAAAGIAAVFNAPIAGVMFASEVILKDFTANTLSTLVVASVSASIVSRAFLGETPAFVVPSYSLQSPWEILIYLGLAVLSAFTAILFIYSLQKSEDFWDRMKVKEWIKPVFGGLIIGIMGLYFPQVFGAGFGTIEDTLHGNLPFTLLLILVFMKIAATSISLGAGSSGGVFAPTLFIGAVLGGAVGHMVSQHFAFPIESSGAYALVGMACVFASGAHAPVTAILIVFEMTNDYHLILPLMASVVVATSISQFIHRESMYTVGLKQKGIDIGFLEEARSWGGLQVRQAMSSKFEQIPNGLPMHDLLKHISGKNKKTFFTIDPQGKLIGIIEYEELQRQLLEEHMDQILAEDISIPIREYCFKNDSLIEIARQMVSNHIDYLPVVDSGDINKVIGVLCSDDILRTYSREYLKRTEIMHHAEMSTGEMITSSFIVPSRSKLAGSVIKDLDIPDGIRFNSIKRGTKSLLPNGDTILMARDRVWVIFLSPQQKDSFQKWFKSQSK